MGAPKLPKINVGVGLPIMDAESGAAPREGPRARFISSEGYKVQFGGGVNVWPRTKGTPETFTGSSLVTSSTVGWRMQEILGIRRGRHEGGGDGGRVPVDVGMSNGAPSSLGKAGAARTCIMDKEKEKNKQAKRIMLQLDYSSGRKRYIIERM